MPGFFQKLFVQPDPDPVSETGKGESPGPAVRLPPAKPPISVARMPKPILVVGMREADKTSPVAAATPFRPMPEKPVSKLFPDPVGDKTSQVTLPPLEAEEEEMVHGSAFKSVEPPPPDFLSMESDVADDLARPVGTATELPTEVVGKTSAVTLPTASPPGRAPLAPLIDDSHLPTTQSAPSMPNPMTEMPNLSSPAAFMPVSTVQPTAASLPATGASSFDDNFGMDFRQLELRAVFGLAAVLSSEAVFQLSTSLPGIKAAAYAVGESLIFQHGTGDVKLDAMPKAVVHLAGLARDLGIMDTRLLTVQTEGGLLAFFSEGAGCLAVLHEGRKFAPGVRERLVIILRELSKGTSTAAG